VLALVVSGANDLLNSQEYTQAAWWNRIATSAWGLLAITASCCNVLVSYGAPQVGLRAAALLIVLPIVISASQRQSGDGSQARDLLRKGLQKHEADSVVKAYNSADTTNMPAGNSMWQLSNAIFWVGRQNRGCRAKARD